MVIRRYAIFPVPSREGFSYLKSYPFNAPAINPLQWRRTRGGLLYNLPMSLTVLELPSHSLKRYRPAEAIRRRKGIENAELIKRRRRARLTAHKAAELLRNEFGAKQVFVFGSFARRGAFTLWSDIDLAARDIPPTRFFEAVGAVTGMSAEFKIDLVDLDDCSTAMRAAIETEGKLL